MCQSLPWSGSIILHCMKNPQYKYFKEKLLSFSLFFTFHFSDNFPTRSQNFQGIKIKKKIHQSPHLFVFFDKRHRYLNQNCIFCSFYTTLFSNTNRISITLFDKHKSTMPKDAILDNGNVKLVYPIFIYLIFFWKQNKENIMDNVLNI